MSIQDYLEIDPNSTPLPQLHQYLLGSVSPRPICFASTIDGQGRLNLAPFSFFNVVSANPPIVVFSPNNSGRDGTPKQTYLNAKEVPEVVVNVVTYQMVQQMNVAAAPWAHGVSEFEKAGFTPLASDLVKPMRVAEAPVQLECKVIDIKEFGEGGGSGKLIMAQVVKLHIKQSVLSPDGKLDPFKLQLVGRMGGAWYCLPEQNSMFELSQPMQSTMGYDCLPEHVRTSSVLTGNDLGQLAGLIGAPTQDDLQHALEWLESHNSKTTNYNDLREKEVGAAQLIKAKLIREAAALLLL
ncbi:MAG: flavin reductase family protein [Sphingomonadales bacterium]|nr:flavin reductase family protein [Sphingomonadales bacterium]